MSSATPPDQDRRKLLRFLSLSPVALMGVGSFASATRAQAQAAGLISANVCMVQTEVTEGPFYIDPKLVRRDITEGRPGVPMRLNLQVVTSDCVPVPGARVDVWHCDAAGIYSGVTNMGAEDTTDQTFLRGTQNTGDDGIAVFDTIYPGWYRGRTTHIHYKVFLDEQTILTSQIFFPDALSAYLFRSVPPYNERGATRDTMNGSDSIARAAGAGAYAAIREQPEYYDASLVVGINPDARSTSGMDGSGGPGGQQPGGTRPAGPPPGGAPDGMEGPGGPAPSGAEGGDPTLPGVAE
ncbi:protocatechuate dioxygenase [Pseudooceanicola sediminis]|uniref:Protocatechuate dioxygenase n=1 Tax=Pseudooceanicola sediminis TaxID=2211117 RepID=A0A399J4U9_9RHOB|nr:intradiol ring-cleavage dioxygenase [Pseudooceanicola sediminis]KAA2314625.1 intradiol ring-cleavage dioxygenase [Puniceibacterium sp. HSS470]RII39419.1 protocatechuate dioxygenase [Pseudooceanicola sediminis]|tara:strand:- start:4210 stop:5094 length:885 start_codon:yes stop_codon:yes gene_type:complete